MQFFFFLNKLCYHIFQFLLPIFNNSYLSHTKFYIYHFVCSKFLPFPTYKLIPTNRQAEEDVTLHHWVGGYCVSNEHNAFISNSSPRPDLLGP